MPNKQLQILLVEDNMSDALLTIRILKKHNLANNFVHLYDGAQALDFVFGNGVYHGRNLTEKPNVIFLDLNMPKVNGLEVLRQLKADSRTKLIPVVAMTSSKEEKDIIESHRLGFNSYIIKPVGFENFSKSVADLEMFWLLVN